MRAVQVLRLSKKREGGGHDVIAKYRLSSAYQQGEQSVSRSLGFPIQNHFWGPTRAEPKLLWEVSATDFNQCDFFQWLFKCTRLLSSPKRPCLHLSPRTRVEAIRRLGEGGR